MKFQFERIEGRRVKTYTSPDITSVSDPEFNEFLNWCGSEGADVDTFWSSGVEEDRIVIDFTDWPSDPQHIVNLFADHLKVPLAPFATWVEGWAEEP